MRATRGSCCRPISGRRSRSIGARAASSGTSRAGAIWISSRGSASTRWDTRIRAWCGRFRTQAERCLHTSNLFHHRYQGLLAERLAEWSGLARVFFSNSGTEAVETALKAARAAGNRQQPRKRKIVALHNAFHGRTMGALAVTGQPTYRQPFEPLMDGVEFIAANDRDALRQGHRHGDGRRDPGSRARRRWHPSAVARLRRRCAGTDRACRRDVDRGRDAVRAGPDRDPLRVPDVRGDWPARHRGHGEAARRRLAVGRHDVLGGRGGGDPDGDARHHVRRRAAGVPGGDRGACPRGRAAAAASVPPARIFTSGCAGSRRGTASSRRFGAWDSWPAFN